MRKLLLMLTIICCLPDTCYAYKDTFETKVGDQFTIDGGSYRYIQAVLWDFDTAVFETVSVSGYSTRATFKAISPSPKAGSIIQATIYYYKSGTTSSGVNKDVVAWKVYVADDGSESTVSLPISMSMDLNEVKTVTATTSSDKYSGKYNWQSSNHFIVEVLSSSGKTATLRANSVGSTYIHVTLDNGNTDAVYVTVKDNTPPPTVSASPSSGTYEKGTKIYLTASQSNATIRYTTNGTTPTSSSQKYTSALTLNESFILKAKAYNASGEGGEILTCNYTVKEEPNILKYNILSATAKTVEVVAPSSGTYKGDIIIPSTVKINNVTYKVVQIGEKAFYNCTDVTSIELPNSITTICVGAFEGCKNISSFTMPSSVTTVYEDAFSNCTNLYSVYISDLKAWCGIDFKNSATGNPLRAVSADLYLNKVKVIDLVLDESISTIKFASFISCRSIKSVKFDSHFKGISGGRVLQSCINLQDIFIPSSIGHIAGYSFAWCPGLKNVYCSATNPPKLDTGWNNLDVDEYFAFYNDNFDKIVLHVPQGYKQAYATAIGWKNFKNILDDYNAGVEDIPEDMINPCLIEVYNLNGVCVGNSTDGLTPGMYIVRQGSTVKKIVVN